MAATKGRSGSALTVRRRHGTGMERATQLRNGDGERAAPTTAHGVRERERERDGHKRDKSVKRLGSSVNHSLALCCAAVSFPPPLSRPSRLRFRYESTRRLRRTKTAASSQLITPSPYILHCRISSPSHTAVITLSATAFLDYINIIIISAPVTRIHLSLHHETDRFVLSSRRAGIDHNTLCCINAPRLQGR